MYPISSTFSSIVSSSELGFLVLYFIFISFARFSTHLSSLILALMCVVHLQASIGLKCLVGAVLVTLNFLMASIIVLELAFVILLISVWMQKWQPQLLECLCSGWTCLWGLGVRFSFDAGVSHANVFGVGSGVGVLLVPGSALVFVVEI